MSFPTSNMISEFFEYVDADVVLHSTPSAVDFHVHRCILSAASPFFRVMFTLPQNPCPDTTKPVLEASEDHLTLETLLRFVYPISNPPIDTLDELTSVLSAAVKYDMTAPIEALRKTLVSPRFVEAAATRVYAIASRFGFEEEAKTASQHTLSVHLLGGPLHDDFKHITAYSYHRLLDLHHRRAQAAQELLKIPDEVKCMQCNAVNPAYVPSFTLSQPKWWKDFQERARKELGARPTTAVIFSLPFLAQSAQAGCPRCASSILDAHWFLQDLKKRIDDLPSTI